MDSDRAVEEYEYDYEEYPYQDDGYDQEGVYEGELAHLNEDDEPLTFDDPDREDLRDLRWDKMYNNVPADVDSRSIKDQEKTKRQWEERLSSGDDHHLFTDQTAPPLHVDVNAANEHEDESIANLSYTKQQWEQKTEGHRRSQEHSPYSPQSPPQLNNNIYKNEPQYESAIEREIRLAQEREKELKLEQERALKQSEEYITQRAKSAEKAKEEATMPIRKVPQPVSSGPTHHAPRQPTTPQTDVRASQDSVFSDGSPKASFNDMTEADRDQMSKNESIIEREIREQQARDKMLLEEGIIKAYASVADEEAEQSGYEPREKPPPLNAQESIIEKEIRLQRERELELSRQREVILHLSKTKPESPAGPPSPAVPEPAAVTPPPKARSPSPQPPAPVEPQKKSPEPAPAPAPFVASSPPPPVPAPTSEEPDMVSYEEAIGNYSHQGESLIARELREQKEKEEELRKRWTEMGYEVPEVSTEKETPFELPQPKTQPRKVEPLPPPQESASFSVQQTSTTPAKNASEESSSSVREPAETAPVSSEPEFKGPRPIKDEEAEAESPSPLRFLYKFVPRNETPVEREIRLARERENEIRHQHGLPALDVPDAQSQQEPVSETIVPHRKSTSDEPTPGKKQMKMFASSRLQLEIQREHRREEELKKSGVIHTTSDQRMADMFKYASVVNEPTVMSAKIPKTPQTPKTPAESAPPESKPTPPEPENEVAPSPVANGGVPPAKEPTPAPAPAPSPAKPEPAVVKRYTQQSTPESEHRPYTRSSGNLAESRIERELREMKEREEDLRRQREMALGIKSSKPAATHNGDNDMSSPRGAASPSPQPQEAPQVELRQRETDHAVKSPRRKSALAEEWERKFGGNV